MDRRSAMFLTLLGGLVPRGLLAQTTGRRNSTKSRTRGAALEPVRGRTALVDDAGDDAPKSESKTEERDVPAGDEAFPAVPGQQWRDYDISHYTSLAHNQNNPQNAIVEWIFRRTTPAEWHGDKIAVLSASRTQIRAYNNANVLKKVDEVVERFIDAEYDLLTIRVRFVAAVDTRWRYAVYSRLTPVVSGPQGQQVWTLKAEDAAFALAQMQIYQGFRLLTNQQVDLVNGQTLVIKTSEPRSFTGGLARESAAGLGYQPRADQLEEGITLKLSPLLTFDGDHLDAAIELTANTVKNLHRTRIIAPREIGSSELTLDVPEVTETRLNQTVKGWPIKQTLLISGGIQPGILQSKGGLFNLRIPGTVPTGTELLVFIDVETKSSNTGGRSRD